MNRYGKDIIKKLKETEAQINGSVTQSKFYKFIKDNIIFKFINNIIKKIQNIYYNIEQGISNIYQWFALIWNDRDFDYHYVYLVLYVKLKKMESFHRSSNAWCCSALKKADDIRTAKLLLKRLINDNYLNNALISVENKYGKRNLEFEICPDNPSFHRIVDNRTEEEQAAYSKAYEHENMMREQDLDLLFKMLRKKITSWWD